MELIKKGSFIEAIKKGNEVTLTLKIGKISGKVLDKDEKGIMLEFAPGEDTFIFKEDITNTEIHWKE